ncbi:hypothetical protein Tco_1409206 [Tanacetum coccineum]
MTFIKNFLSFGTVNTSLDHPIGAHLEEIWFVPEIMLKFREELALLGCVEEASECPYEFNTCLSPALSKELLQQMIDLGLEVEEESTATLQLLRFIKQQLNEEHKNWLVHKQTAFGKDKSNPLIVGSLLKTTRLTNISGDDVSDFDIALRMPETTRPNIKKRAPYTPYQDPQGFIYADNQGRNRLMRLDELYKFSDGTLTRL